MSEGFAIDLSKSPRSRIHPVSIESVEILDPFWKRRIQQAVDVELPAQIAHCERTGRIANLERAAGIVDGSFEGRFFNDSDVYKILEAAGWACLWTRSDEIESWIDRMIQIIEAAQEDDGYLNSYFTGSRATERWTDFTKHELYCAGHLAQAAVAILRTLGDDRLIAVATRLMDHICDRFDNRSKDPRFTSGHPEIELALVELYRVTGNDRYLKQADSFVRRRGTSNMVVHGTEWDAEYHQDVVPLVDQTRIVGHAVRAMYLNAGATDLVLEGAGPRGLDDALDTMWTSFATKQMSITGGLGARWETEGMGNDYELPDRAYNETCASIGSIMWNWRMLHLDPDGRYSDLIETTLYNGVLSGVSDDGSGYFYQNPLADDGHHRRREWFDVACCPTNWIRLAVTFPGYVYGRSGKDVWVHQYVASRLHMSGNDGPGVLLETRYPREGSVTLTVETSGRFTVFLRKPGWAESFTVRAQDADIVDAGTGYTSVTKDWVSGDQIQVDIPLNARAVGAPAVASLRNLVAFSRGPIVYCAESVDNGHIDVRFVDVVSLNADIKTSPPSPDAYPSPTLSVDAVLVDYAHSQKMYTEYRLPESRQPIALRLRPYATWAQNSAGPMTVFLRCGEPVVDDET